ncbi:MAG: hypothetical protein Q8O19_04620, partial [Rectinemataceae bacterium]|nr:hypothetical protein [Rectinemataceae bacterium]
MSIPGGICGDAGVIDWVTDIHEIEKLEPEWLAFETSVQDRTSFSSYRWVIPWYRNYCGASGAPLVGVARRNGRLI